jgi:hypothetical protein
MSSSKTSTGTASAISLKELFIFEAVFICDGEYRIFLDRAY